MLISLCIPVHNRTHDLKRTMPYIIEAANASPPVEIAVLDYNSPDDLSRFIQAVNHIKFDDDVSMMYRKYVGRTHFHKAHAFNLAILMSHGEYFVLMGADAYPESGYIAMLRTLIDQGYQWMHGRDLCGIVACERKAFIDAGGYDERFEFYGPEDRDLDDRMMRRGLKFGAVPRGLMHVIPTPDEDKVKDYGVNLSKRQMSKLMRRIYDENNANALLVANQGKLWGQWL